MIMISASRKQKDPLASEWAMNSESSVADSPLYRIRVNRNRKVNELEYPNDIEPQVYTITTGEGNVNCAS
jgi:hypothetical protein